MSDLDAFCPRCSQHLEDGRAWNRDACGHEWHGEETLAGPGEDGPEPPEEIDRIAAETLERAATIGQQSRLRTVGVAQEIDPAYLAQESGSLEGPPRAAVDPDDDRFAEAVYAAYLSEPYGLVPWERLGDHAHDAYRRSAHRARELLDSGPAAPEPQRVVVGFGSPAVVAHVLAVLASWRDSTASMPPDRDEFAALIERIESGE